MVVVVSSLLGKVIIKNFENTVKVVLLEEVYGAVDKLLPLLLVLRHPAVLCTSLVPAANGNHDLRSKARKQSFGCQRVSVASVSGLLKLFCLYSVQVKTSLHFCIFVLGFTFK